MFDGLIRHRSILEFRIVLLKRGGLLPGIPTKLYQTSDDNEDDDGCGDNASDGSTSELKGLAGTLRDRAIGVDGWD